VTSKTRAQRIYDALACHPGGLSTPGIMELSGESDGSGQGVLSDYGKILRRHERRGHIRRVGIAGGGSGQFHAVTWQLTPGTRREDFGAVLPPSRIPAGPLPARQPVDVRAMIGALAAGLPPEGSAFTREQRRAWVEAAAAVMTVAWGPA